MGSGGQSSVKAKVAVATTSTTSSNKATLSIDDFAKMSPKEQWDLIEKAIAGPAHDKYFAWGSNFQKFINNSGLDGAPDLFDDDALDKEAGMAVYRTVYGNASFTAGQIVDKTLNDKELLYNAGGGQAYGKGIYTAASTIGSAAYQRGENNSAMMRYVVDTNRMTDEMTITNQFNKEARRKGSLAAKLKQKYGDVQDTDLSIYALSKGYTSIRHGNYITIISRQGLKASKSIKDAYECYQKDTKAWKAIPKYKGK